MFLLDRTLPTAAENLALDEALLELAERSTTPGEVLRVWESPQRAVIIGRSSHADQEVNLEHCRRHGVPVLRRTSGGAAVVIGPGCLMYSLVLRRGERPELQSVSTVHCYVLDQMVAALRRHVAEIARRGTSDLAVDELKVSGNSLRCRRDYVLYHGTLLYAADVDAIEKCLRFPPRVPDYRRGRAHRAFVTNLPLEAKMLRAAIIEGWDAREAYPHDTAALVDELIGARYGRDEWNLGR